MYYIAGMSVYSLRSDPQVDAALVALGATPGNRSRIMKSAILALAAWQRDHPDQDVEVLRDISTIVEVQRDLDSIKARLTKLMGTRL